jgi:hypothetical protein
MYLLLSLNSSIPIIHIDIASEHYQDFENTLHIALPVFNSYYSLGIQQHALMHKHPIHLYPLSLPLYEQRRHQYSCYLVYDIITLLVHNFHHSFKNFQQHYQFFCWRKNILKSSREGLMMSILDEGV